MNKALPLIIVTLIAIAGMFFIAKRKSGTDASVQPAQPAPAQTVNQPEAAPGDFTPIVTKTGLKMTRIPAGEFMMGDSEGADDEKPVHKVKLDGFLIDVYEVTQESFQALTGVNTSKFKDKTGPVERTRWLDAVMYCNARSEKEGLTPCYDLKTWVCDFTADGYRLPTEAEWEYACRGGVSASRFFGQEKPERFAWFRKNSQETVHPVGEKKPNAFGLYDMYGNVSEWCNDFYDEKYYQNSPEENPRGAAEGKKRVLRGGNWSSREKHLRSAKREADAPATGDICQGYDTYGFRCVRAVPKE
jgi:formylglycine-generating enzyme required for sulfatase activity